MEAIEAKVVAQPSSAEAQSGQRVEALCLRMKSGDEAAFRLFFESFADRVFRFCLVLTKGNEHLSRDLLQQVLIKCARGVPVFDSEKTLWAWLAQVAKHGYIDHLRREKSRPVEWTPKIAEDEPASSEDEGGLMEALEASLRELPEEERKLIEAIYEQRLPHKKVAELSNTTPKAVENKLARLRRKLRENILNKLRNYALI